jgi:hypothetical protein
MFRGLFGKGLGRFFSEHEPQSLFKQFYDLRIFLVGHPYTYRLEYFVFHGDSLGRNKAEIWSVLNTRAMKMISPDVSERISGISQLFRGEPRIPRARSNAVLVAGLCCAACLSQHPSRLLSCCALSHSRRPVAVPV